MVEAEAVVEVYVRRRWHLIVLLAVRFPRNKELLWMLTITEIAPPPRSVSRHRKGPESVSSDRTARRAFSSKQQFTVTC